MNPKILQSCVEELKSEKPNIQYVLGKLETLIEMMPNITVGPTYSWSGVGTSHETKNKTNHTETVADEAKTTEGDDIPEFLKPGPVARQTN